MIGSFFHVWFQLVFLFCFIALLGGGLPAVVTLFWPNVFLGGILAFFSTSIAIAQMGREASEQLQKK